MKINTVARAKLGVYNLFTNSSSRIIFSNWFSWFTVVVNLSNHVVMLSFSSILNISYWFDKRVILDSFTCVVPSWVTFNLSQISFAVLHVEIRLNSVAIKKKCRVLIVLKFIWTFFNSALVHSSLGFGSNSWLVPFDLVISA